MEIRCFWCDDVESAKFMADCIPVRSGKRYIKGHGWTHDVPTGGLLSHNTLNSMKPTGVAVCLLD